MRGGGDFAGGVGLSGRVGVETAAVRDVGFLENLSFDGSFSCHSTVSFLFLSFLLSSGLGTGRIGTVPSPFFEGFVDF